MSLAKLHLVGLVLAIGLWVFAQTNTNRVPRDLIPEPTAAPVSTMQFPDDTSLLRAKKYFSGTVLGAEATIQDDKGRIFTGLLSGELVELDFANNRTTSLGRVGHRPLGLAFHHIMKQIIVADAVDGLLAVDVDKKIVTKLLTEVNGEPIRTCNNVAVASNGDIFFSDATRILALQQSDGIYLTYPAAAITCALGDRYGKLHKFDPVTRKVTTLIKGISYANGVALSKDEDFVVVGETCGYRIHRYFLKGDKAGKSELFFQGLPGFVDNIKPAAGGGFWVPIVSRPSRLVNYIAPFPLLKHFVARLPFSLFPHPAPVGTIFKIGEDATIQRALADPNGDVVHHITDVYQIDNKLYISSVTENWVATFDL